MTSCASDYPPSPALLFSCCRQLRSTNPAPTKVAKASNTSQISAPVRLNHDGDTGAFALFCCASAPAPEAALASYPLPVSPDVDRPGVLRVLLAVGRVVGRLVGGAVVGGGEVGGGVVGGGVVGSAVGGVLAQRAGCGATATSPQESTTTADSISTSRAWESFTETSLASPYGKVTRRSIRVGSVPDNVKPTLAAAQLARDSLSLHDSPWNLV